MSSTTEYPQSEAEEERKTDPKKSTAKSNNTGDKAGGQPNLHEATGTAAEEERKTDPKKSAAKSNNTGDKAGGQPNLHEATGTADKGNDKKKDDYKVLFLSARTYDKNECISEITGQDIDLHQPVNEVKPVTGNGFTCINCPGLYDTEPDNVDGVKEVVKNYLKKNSSHWYQALVIVLQFPVRWTPEDQSFIKDVIEDIFIKKVIWENVFIVVANYKPIKGEAFKDYLKRMMKDFSSTLRNPFFTRNVPRSSVPNKLGDLYRYVTIEKCYQSETSYKELLEKIKQVAPFQVKLD